VKYSTKKQSKFMTLLVTIFAVFFIAGNAFAKTQQVTLSTESTVAFTKEAVAVKILYDVIDGDNKTSGIGIRIHFNSKFIDDVSLSDVYGEGMIGQHYTPQDDVKDIDADPSTDKFIVVAWASVTGQWPVFLSMPGALAVLNLNIKEGAPNGETKINVTASAVAAGCEFLGKSAKILVQ